MAEEEKAVESAAGPGELARAAADAIAAASAGAPTRGNRKLEALLEGVNSDEQVRAWWHMAQVTSERLGMSDHSWVHVQIVLNIALRLLRLLTKAGVEPAMVSDHAMGVRDAEVVVAGGALLHDVGLSIHRADHEAYSLFLAREALQRLLADSYKEPQRTVVIAEILHANSAVKQGPFVALNCGAIPADLIEAELFGADAGAYTGATKSREGKFEAADGGTLFLDEVGTLPPAGQVKLLRVLETGRFQRLGSNREQQVKVRVVSATNADLPALIRNGQFREDLYYRLNAIELQ